MRKIAFIFVIVATLLLNQSIFAPSIMGADPLPPPVLKRPGTSEGEILNTLTPTFEWEAVPGVTEYRLYISRYADPWNEYSTLTFDSSAEAISITGMSFALPAGFLKPGIKYRWNMNSFNGKIWGPPNSDRLYFITSIANGGVRGIDVSTYQDRIDWDAVCEWKDKEGRQIEFAYVKSTEGTYNVLESLEARLEGEILYHKDNGISADGYEWWYVRFGDKTGWLARHLIEKLENPTDKNLVPGEKIRTITKANLRTLPGIIENGVNDKWFNLNMKAIDTHNKQLLPNECLLVGVYHYARPSNDPVSEARHFVAIARDYLKPVFLRPMLDFESGQLANSQMNSEWIRRFISTVKELTEGVEPIVYTLPSFANPNLDNSVGRYDLWTTHPQEYEPYTCPVDYFPEPGAYAWTSRIWDSWVFWQYGVTGKHHENLPGINADDRTQSYAVDLDVFNGDRTALEEFIIARSSPPEVVLVIDRSGSMAGSKISDATWAARYFVDLMQLGDKLGVVSFSSDVRVDHSLSEIVSIDTKIVVKGKIDMIFAGGLTAMGDGLRTACEQLVDYGDSSHADRSLGRSAIILMSDGWHNYGSEHPNAVIEDLKAEGIKVYTIGVGTGADENLLKRIAIETRGSYYFAPKSEDLSSIYRDIAGIVAQTQIVSSASGLLTEGETTQVDVNIDSSIAQATFTINWPGSNLDLVLVRPDKTMIDPSFAAVAPGIEHTEETRYEIYRITSPMPGPWQMIITAVAAPPQGVNFSAQVIALTSLTLTFATDKDSYTFHEQVLITTTIEDWDTPVLGSNVEASVTRPDGSQISTVLFDDGSSIHGDQVKNDGSYANYFGQYTVNGSYTVRVTATGKTSNGDLFTRYAEKTVSASGGEWDYTFSDNSRGTLLRVNTKLKLFQFVTPEKDYGVKNATNMQIGTKIFVKNCFLMSGQGNSLIVIFYEDEELSLTALALDKLDYCAASVSDTQAQTRYLLIDDVGEDLTRQDSYAVLASWLICGPRSYTTPPACMQQYLRYMYRLLRFQ